MRLSKFSNGDPNCRVKISLKCQNKEVGYIITSANGIIDNGREHPVKKGNGGTTTG